jgi:hypothetical protein
MRFAVETWAPDYGAPVDEAVLGDTAAQVDLAAEVPLADWAPVTPGQGPVGRVLFVDGVQRIDARVWVTDDDGISHLGVCASWAAGVVCCDERAQVVSAEVRRGVLVPGIGDDPGPITTVHGSYRPYPVPEAGDDPVGQALGRQRGDLEGRVAARARQAPGGDQRGGAGVGEGAGRGEAPPQELLVVDGPLGGVRHVPGTVGYVKAHHVSYLGPAQQLVVGALRPGQRTPLFTVGGERFRWSWYLRLPGPATHPWWGVVRCEAPGEADAEAAATLADRVSATLPRFASQPHNDARAPQNLHPIAGLERELRRRLGDPLVLERALRRAAGR